jgi:hypothetical protein
VPTNETARAVGRNGQGGIRLEWTAAAEMSRRVSKKITSRSPHRFEAQTLGAWFESRKHQSISSVPKSEGQHAAIILTGATKRSRLSAAEFRCPQRGVCFMPREELAKANRPQVAECAICATPKSLELQAAANIESPCRNICAIISQLYTLPSPR